LFDAKKAGGVNHMKILALEKEFPVSATSSSPKRFWEPKLERRGSFTNPAFYVNCTSALTKTRQFWCWNARAPTKLDGHCPNCRWCVPV
jgi:hypothetical protein